MTDGAGTELLKILLLCVAVYRATRLLVTDDLPLVAHPRAWTLRHAPGWLGDLVTCPWCTSVWVGVPIVWLADASHGLAFPVLTWVAAATFTGWVSRWDEPPDERLLPAARPTRLARPDDRPAPPPPTPRGGPQR
jgi:Protein of unknown function (DUF1360)